jgi:hypothetical protein
MCAMRSVRRTLKFLPAAGPLSCLLFHYYVKAVDNRDIKARNNMTLNTLLFSCLLICLWLGRHADFILWRACRRIKA